MCPSDVLTRFYQFVQLDIFSNKDYLLYIDKITCLTRLQRDFAACYCLCEPNNTVAALTYFMHQVTSLLEENNYVRFLLIDFSKAFDKVDHIILVRNSKP